MILSQGFFAIEVDYFFFPLRGYGKPAEKYSWTLKYSFPFAAAGDQKICLSCPRNCVLQGVSLSIYNHIF